MIMQAAEAQRSMPAVPAMAVSKRFGRFKDEEEHAVRAPQRVAEDQVLGQLKGAWMKFQWIGEHWDAMTGNMSGLEAVKGLTYTAKDVERFSIALAEFQGEEDFREKAGYFLSALINNCPDSDFVIHTKHLEKKIEYLGLHNTKNITIDGDAGNVLGREMIGGRITVKGSTRDWAGLFMKNGEIVIEGDSGNGLGREMKSGKITVERNASRNVGMLMVGGEIVIEGNGGEQVGFHMKGGKITVKGNATNLAGYGMESGEIVIDGDCGEDLGNEMEGGKITVKGNGGECVGLGMAGGTIRIDGDYVSLDKNIKGGKIYHKGKLIYPRGDHAS